MTPSTDTAITEATTYTYTYAQKESISHTVTFKVENGSWNNGEGAAATEDKTVTLTGYEGDTLKLTAEQIPAVGTKPADTYKTGSWDVTPSTETAITEATTYTYTYAARDSISQTVTFIVVNGSWDDETAADKTVTLTGLEGDSLKLTAEQIPDVGNKPNDDYKAGNWDVTPSTDAAITEATTYTYTYAQKESISQTVTFKVVNGSWNDKTTADKTVTLSRRMNRVLNRRMNRVLNRRPNPLPNRRMNRVPNRRTNRVLNRRMNRLPSQPPNRVPSRLPNPRPFRLIPPDLRMWPYPVTPSPSR